MASLLGVAAAFGVGFWVKLTRFPSQEEMVQLAADVIDKNGDGDISSAELENYLRFRYRAATVSEERLEERIKCMTRGALGNQARRKSYKVAEEVLDVHLLDLSTMRKRWRILRRHLLAYKRLEIDPERELESDARSRVVPERPTELTVGVMWRYGKGNYRTKQLEISHKDTMQDVLARCHKAVGLPPKLYQFENQPAWFIVQLGAPSDKRGYALLYDKKFSVADLCLSSEDSLIFLAPSETQLEIFFRKYHLSDTPGFAHSRDRPVIAAEFPPAGFTKAMKAWHEWTTKNPEQCSQLTDPLMVRSKFARVVVDGNVFNIKAEQLTGVKECNPGHYHLSFNGTICCVDKHGGVSIPPLCSIIH
eukprot:gene15384-18199_t